jgi:hypothetical protein
MALRLAASTASAALSLALAAFASGCGSGEKAAAPAPPSMPAAAPAPAPAPVPAPAAPQAAAMPEAAPGAAPAAGAAGSGAYPADFPADVPRYPGSKVASARGSAQDGFAITIEAPDSVDVVAKGFGDGLTAAGWETMLQASPEGTMVIATKQDGARATALVHDGGQGAVIDLIVARPE